MVPGGVERSGAPPAPAATEVDRGVGTTAAAAVETGAGCLGGASAGALSAASGSTRRVAISVGASTASSGTALPIAIAATDTVGIRLASTAVDVNTAAGTFATIGKVTSCRTGEGTVSSPFIAARTVATLCGI